MLRLPEITSVSEPWWDNDLVAIVGAGPSLRGFDFEVLKGRCRVVAVKEMIFELPWADCGFAIDPPWMRRKHENLMEIAEKMVFAVDHDGIPRKYTVIPGATYHQRTRADGLSFDPDIITCGGTSGYAALNYVTLKRARNILLLGFDYRVKPGDLRTGHHYKDESYPWYHRQNERYWANWADDFDLCAHQLRQFGVNVYLLKTEFKSAITAFQEVDVESFLSIKSQVAA